MESELAIEASREAIKVCLVVGGPILAVCLIVGLLMGFAQAMSHIQDQALATIPKILAIFAVVGFALPWFADRMIDFSKQQFSRPMMVAGSSAVESESNGVVRSLFENEAMADDSYYPRVEATRLERPRWNPSAATKTPAKTTPAITPTITTATTPTMQPVSFARERVMPQEIELQVPLPEVWNPPAIKKKASENPFQLPSHRFTRRPNANIEG